MPYRAQGAPLNHGVYFMELVFQTLNQLEKEGIIEKYALGGAIALLFYTEPTFTQDVDVFIFLPGAKTQTIITLTSLYDYLTSRGGIIDGPYVKIGTFPVQFMQAPSQLEEEGVEKAEIKNYNGVPVKVLSLEYLMAIMLKTYRPKDIGRLGQIIEEKVPFNQKKLSQILSDFNPDFKLTEKWQKLNNIPKTI